ncbi:probable disease resistance protein At1g12290 [Herrania umbratica]|uniref:Probable disease resistance protein At1g12290 n=1 Tax=Herrania umbratica TaxID=108875 RepID=A0A6J1BGQ5_9ROSI|nr:probable disease resistance protein At1g12290 [Herrania umbratica]
MYIGAKALHLPYWQSLRNSSKQLISSNPQFISFFFLHLSDILIMGNLWSVSISTEDTVSRCWDCIAGQASYTCKLEENLEALRVELDTLKARKDDVNQKVDLAEQKRMTWLSEVSLWLSRVQTAEAGAEQLIKDGPQEIQKLLSRKLAEIVDLKNQGVFERVAENQRAAQVDVRPTGTAVGLEPTFDKTWRLLEQNNVGIIGLHGLGGVGKTKLLTQINNKLSNDLMGYDVVIWVVVSKDHYIETVQEKIGQKLSLSHDETWKNKSFDEKAVEIRKVLSKKKFVMLLDDVWERVDLIKVGIPEPDQENCSKLIFTTRSLDVCGQMGAHKNIKVECLSKADAWKLFEEKVGEETLNSHPAIRGLAKQVAANCGGLPLALITIGRAMAYSTMPKHWEHAIKVLEEFPHKLASMDKEVYSLLKFSYDNLPTDTMRSCLLYCSLYPKDFEIPIDELKDYWFCEGILDESDNIIDARMQGEDIIKHLVNACLLERCGDFANRVKMHDVICDMALWIARECEALEKRFFVRTGVRSIKVVDDENWKVVRMSLAYGRIEDLEGTPTCPNLQTLFLNNNQLKVIRDGFFQFMHNLKVLNLSSNHSLCELPQGISELVSLECLDLQKTKITELPIQLKKLSKLKYLDLRGTICLFKIPRQLIRKFSMLQIFKIFPINVSRADIDSVLNRGSESLIEELKFLQHLNVLWMEINTDVALESLLSCHNLRGCTERLLLKYRGQKKVFNVLFLENMERLKNLEIKNCDSIEEMVTRNIEEESGERRMIKTSPLFPTNSNNITPRFHALTKISIDSCRSLRNLTWLIFAPNLMRLEVIWCTRMEEIISEVSEAVNVAGILNPSPFAELERLHLRSLPELKSIYWDALPFPCLREIIVFNCPKLKKLPLNCDSAKGNQISIVGSEEWSKEVEWKDDVTRSTFLHSFKLPY